MLCRRAAFAQHKKQNALPAPNTVQLELDVVAENARAISMYQTAGFVEYGRNPKGFRSRNAGYQELISMRLEL